MKAWVVSDLSNDWCGLLHAETRGDAKVKASREYYIDFVDVRVSRLPGLDDKPITYDNAKAAGFRYEDPLGDGEYDEYDGICYMKPEHFSNWCRCDICTGGNQ
jgi:hypothetical protein